MAVLHWKFQYIINVFEMEGKEEIPVDEYNLSFNDGVVDSLFLSDEYGNPDYSDNIEKLEYTTSHLELFSEGAIEFDEYNDEFVFFPLMTEEERNAVENEKVYVGANTVKIGITVEKKDYEDIIIEHDAEENAQYAIYQYYYSDFQDGSGEEDYEEIEPVENMLEMSPSGGWNYPESTFRWDLEFWLYTLGTDKRNPDYVFKSCSACPIGTLDGSELHKGFLKYNNLNEYATENAVLVHNQGFVTGFAISGYSTTNTNPQTGNYVWGTDVYYPNGQATHYTSNTAAYGNHYLSIINQGKYSGFTSQNFSFSVSGDGHQAAIFSGTYYESFVCTELSGNPTSYANDIPIEPDTFQSFIINSATVEQNVYSAFITDSCNSGVMFCDIGIGSVTGRTGMGAYVKIHSSATTHQNTGMPFFMSRLGSPGLYKTLPPNNPTHVTMKTTGEVASVGRAKAIFSSFPSIPSIGGNNSCFTRNQFISTPDSQFFTVNQQNLDQNVLLSEIIYDIRYGQPFDDENGYSGQSFNYSVNQNVICSSSTQSIGIPTPLLGPPTKYLICLPTIYSPTHAIANTTFTLRLDIPNNHRVLHFYKSEYCASVSPDNKIATFFQPTNNIPEYINLGAILYDPYSTYNALFLSIYDNYGHQHIIPQQSLFIIPITHDNYLDVNDPRPVDAADMP